MTKGRCVICNGVGPLTDDHAPLKSVTEPRPLEIRQLPELLNSELAQKAVPRGGFQAPVFRTLCNTCNSVLLGQHYDPTLSALVEEIKPFVRALARKIILPDGINVTTKPLRLARSVVGHLLAAEYRPTPYADLTTGDLSEKMRSFFLDKTAPWPKDLHFYLWPYAGRQQYIVRGFGFINALGRQWGPVVGDLLKFFPLAFWITDSDALVSGYHLTPLPLGEDLEMDSEVELKIAVTEQPSLDWPQSPGETGIILMAGERTSVAKPLSVSK